MSRLDPEKLHIRYIGKTEPATFTLPRRYTLTHSDRTGDLFLSVGSDYNHKQISGLYTRLMRDEIIAEWQEISSGPSLHVYCHVSGGLVLGTAKWREKIIRGEMPLVLEVLRYSERDLIQANPRLDSAPIWVHFMRSREKDSKTEQWGVVADYLI